MPADVIINPTSGEIYWNDGTGSPQSISIRGDSQNKIDIIGYSASFSPGGSGVGTFVLATFNDNSGAAAFAPGTSGNELGSSLLRWKPFLTTTTISDSASSLGTNSTTLLTGVIQVNGGIAISGNASIGQSVLFFNKTNPIYFVGISAPASLASTTNYFLPTNYPGAGTSILQSNTTGTLSWVPLVASSAGLATTAQNVQVVLVGNPNSQHSVLLTPTVSSAGSAVSGNGTLVYNPSTDVLSTPGLAVTSAATAVSYLNAPALITGGLAVGDNITALNKIGVGVSTSAVTRAEVYASGTDVGFRMFETTGALARFSLSRNGMGTNVPALNFLNSGSFGANGSGIGVLNATSVASIALFASDGTNANVVRFLVIGGATRVTTNEISIGTDTSGTAFTSILRGVNATGTDISTSDFILQAGRSTGTGTNNGIRFQVATPATSTGSALNAATDVVKMNTSQNATSSSTGTMIVYGGVGISGNANIGGSTLQLGVSWINNATNATTSSTAAAIITGGLAVGSNAIIGGSTLQSGVAWINNSTNATSSTTGALIVTGGLALGANAFIGGSTHIVGIDWVNNATNATSSSAAALRVTGGLALGTNAIIGGSTLQSGVSWINNATNATNSATAALIVTGGLALGSNAIIGGSTLQSGISWINNSTNATNSSTGALIVTGGLALGSNAIIGGSTIQSGVSWINNTTASTSTSTGAMIVGGGVGIGQTLFVGGMIRLGTNTFTKTNSLGDIALDNGSATDTPAITFYWANNSNFGTDVFSDGVGSTRYRVVWNINESGGREVFTVDQNATMRLYNSSGANYFALKYTGAGTTIYTLPTSTPAGTAVSVLQSTYEGVMSWVPMSSTAVLSAATGAGNTTLYLLFSNITSGSGVALSTNTSVFYNSATTQLTAPYLYSSNSIGSEGGEIVLNKPASGSGLTTTITIDIQADRLRFFETGGANRGFYLDFSTDSVAGVGKNIIGSASFATTASNVQAQLVGNPNSQHALLLTPTVSSAGSAVSGNGTLVYNPSTDILSTPGLAVTSTTATTSTTTGAARVSGGIGIVGNAFIGGTINVASPITIPNGGTNASSFGQTAGFIYYDGANIRLAAATGASINFTNGYYQFDNRVYATSFFANNSQIPNGSGGSGRVTYWSGNNTIAANANFLWDNTNNIFTVLGNTIGIGLTASGIAATSTLSATSTTSAALTVTGGLALGSNAIIGGSTLQSGVAWINNSTNATSSSSAALYVTGGLALGSNAIIGGSTVQSGIAWINNNTNASSSTTGALIVTGGLALGSNAFIGGSTHIVGISWVNNSTNATASSSAALRVTGGLALGTNAIIGGSTLQSGVAWINNSTNATTSATGALIVTGGLALGTNAIIGGSTLQSGVSWINNATNATTSATGALVVTGGLALGTNAIIGGSTVQAGVAWVNNSTNATTTSSAALYVTGGLAVGTNAFIGGTFTHTDTTDSLTTNGGSIVTRGGVGIARNAAIGASLLFTNGTNANLVGFRAGVTAANTMYVLPLNYPGSGTSVLTSDTSGTLSWAAAATGSGSPGGNATEIQFNNGGTFGGATGLTYQSTLYLTSIASTADQRAVTTVGLRLINHATVSIGGVQVRYSPALELVGKAVVNPSTEYFNRFVTDAYGTTGSYAAQQQWKYSYDTGTPGYSNPLFVIHSHKGIGIGQSSIIYQSFFRANTSQGAELTYVLPVAYPGTGTSVLSSDTTGNLSWVPMTTGGSGTPGGSTRQVQYNNGGTFGGATGFEYVSAGNAVTVSYFSAAGGGSTVGMVICAVNGTTTRVGIGLTNPAFELEILGEISATNKSFVIDHPTKSGMKLRYGSLEGPENGVYVRGQLVGSNVIVPPDHWFGLVHEDSYTVHLTPIGNYQNLYIEKIEDYKVYVGTASTFDVNCYYSVWAERKDIPKLIVEY